MFLLLPTAIFQKRNLKNYNADLANGLGNLIARVAKLCENSSYVQMGSESRASGHLISIEGYSDAISQFRFNDALSFVWKKSQLLISLLTMKNLGIFKRQAIKD